MVIILEKEGNRKYIAVADHIAQRDRMEIDNTDPRIPLVTPYTGGPIPIPKINREIYHRTGRTVDGHPVFEYKAPVQWVAGVMPVSYEIKVGRFKLRVFKWQGAPWFATCEGLFNRHKLKSPDLDDAKAEALGLVRNILNKILIDMEDLPCR